MRIAYDNLLDDLLSANITYSTETTLYEATKVQDQRLTTQWRTTAATSQTIVFAATANTIVGGNIGLVTGSVATNLITDPEDMSQASWLKLQVTASIGTSIVGVPSGLVTTLVSTTSCFVSIQDIAITTTTPAFVYTTRKGTVDDTRVQVINSTTESVLGESKVVIFYQGSDLHRWGKRIYTSGLDRR